MAAPEIAVTLDAANDDKVPIMAGLGFQGPLMRQLAMDMFRTIVYLHLHILIIRG